MRYAPYAESAANDIYHLLFCDDPSAFAPAADGADWQRTLYAQTPSVDAVAALARDTTQDARVRALACNWLSAHGQPVEAKKLLGVVVEVALDEGLDALAAYGDGSVRYLNHTGRMSIFEGRNVALERAIDRLFAASREVVSEIGPWDKARLAPPAKGRVRLTFIVTDGLYFGDGPMDVLQRDAMAGPVIAAAGELLQRVVEIAVN
jgi:hypothetical protein